MPIPVKGLTDIRTHSGSADRTFLPHKAYMGLSCLELEKTRRQTERRGASRRIHDIDIRFAEIDRKKRQLLDALDKARLGEVVVAQPARSRSARIVRY